MALIAPVFAEGDRCVTFALHEDDRDQIQIEIPEGWKKLLEKPHPKGHELIFYHAAGNRQCKIRAARKNPDYPFVYHFNEPAEVIEVLFLKNKYLLPYHRASRELWWMTYTKIHGETAKFRGKALFPLRDCLFCVAIRNEQGLQLLADDASMFIRSIKIVPKP